MELSKFSPPPLSTPLPAKRANNHGPLSVGGRLGTLLGVAIPPAGLVVAVVGLWGWGFHWTDLGVFLGMYALTVLGITIGFHRLFVHRSFETSMPVKVALTACGSMALEGTMIHWVALHRWHHQHSDHPDDVHSPHQHGRGVFGFLLGFWHAHIGWAFYADPPGLDHYVQDLKKSPTLCMASALFPLWVALGLVIPTAIGGVLTGTWTGAGTALLWGGFVRILVVHHMTWSVNSVCHIWGRRTYQSADQSRDNALFGVLAFGEGWHNSHHAFPTSARHGLRWWQLDVTYCAIRILSLVGLVWNVRVPTREAQRRQLRTDARDAVTSSA